MALSQSPICAKCNSKDKLLRCAACKVIFYCGKDHQLAGRDEHKIACSLIKKGQLRLDIEEQKLRNFPGDFMMAANPFETGVGHFWGMLGTRDYMRARYAVVEGLLRVKTKDSVQQALDHIWDMLRLCN